MSPLVKIRASIHVVGESRSNSKKCDRTWVRPDYSRPEARAYILSSLADMANRYDVDGFQLDWMRFPRDLSGQGKAVWDKRTHVTKFMTSVRRLLDEIGVSVNETTPANPRRPSSADIFMAFPDKSLLNREPNADICRIFMVPPAALSPGEKTIVGANNGKTDSSVARLDRGVGTEPGLKGARAPPAATSGKHRRKKTEAVRIDGGRI